ncbi:MAG: diguanylate cyclase [Novosphingobium sp.]|uniref:sensor domain-containing diguanylate cyclase n=1 Tax=Novosphingobium sp. TaxID=1874826 RepID=UPI0032BF05BB
MRAAPVNLKRFLLMLLRLLAGLWLVAAAPALAGQADADGLAPVCHGYAETEQQAQALRDGKAAWICADRDWQANSRHALLRFDLGNGGLVPAQLAVRLGRFEAVRIDITQPDGTNATHRFLPRDFAPQGNMGAALGMPDAGTAARQITVELVTPTVAGMVGGVRLHAKPQPLIGTEQLWIAVLTGLLLVPLFFNLALYRVLRDRFLLWHVGVVGFMLMHTLVTSGFAPLIGAIPVNVLALLVALTFSGGAACALMMASEFIEADKLGPRLRLALRLAALWVVLNAGFYVSTVDWLQGRGSSIYLGNWIVVIAVLAAATGSAVLRGSRSAKFLVASWLPLILTGVWQIGESLLGDQSEPMILFIIQRFAIGAEVLITSVGIADRFIQLRRDHESHRALASELTRLAERDPLTGLLNRRAIEARFAALRADGFATLALLDLDQFKSVNDRFGHATGDAVLRAVSATLPEDRDALAVRMGGEEFMLLLRGRDAVQRAEQVRQALTARVAHEVAGLDGPVTASMGLVEIPSEVMPDATFASIYARADGLLYQAKRAGRNRTVRERMTIFARSPAARGKSAAA